MANSSRKQEEADAAPATTVAKRKRHRTPRIPAPRGPGQPCKTRTGNVHRHRRRASPRLQCSFSQQSRCGSTRHAPSRPKTRHSTVTDQLGSRRKHDQGLPTSVADHGSRINQQHRASATSWPLPGQSGATDEEITLGRAAGLSAAPAQEFSHVREQHRTTPPNRPRRARRCPKSCATDHGRPCRPTDRKMSSRRARGPLRGPSTRIPVLQSAPLTFSGEARLCPSPTSKTPRKSNGV